MPTRRDVHRLELKPHALEQLNKFCRTHKVFQRIVASQLLEWFVAQRPTVQAIVLGFYPEKPEKDLAPLLLRALQQEAAEKAAGARPGAARRGNSAT